jgi:hypothetical protein
MKRDDAGCPYFDVLFTDGDERSQVPAHVSLVYRWIDGQQTVDTHRVCWALKGYLDHLRNGVADGIESPGRTARIQSSIVAHDGGIADQFRRVQFQARPRPAKKG